MPYRTINKSDFPGMADTTVATPVNAGHSFALHFSEKPADTTCGCCGDRCCTGRCCPVTDDVEPFPELCTGASGDNPLPLSLTVELSATFQHPPTGVPPASGFTPPANSNCYDFSFPIFLVACRANDIRTYMGVGTNTCVWCGTTYTIKIHVELTCFGLLTLQDYVPVGDCERVVGHIMSETFQHSCDPILLSGDMNHCLDCGWQCNLGMWEPFPGVWVPVIAIHAPFCLSVTIYESP